MPATLILTTLDPGLETAWKKQLLPREPATFARPADLQRELLRSGSRIWLTDINDPRTRLSCAAGTLVILVGLPHSLPFEQARQNRTARLFLSYAESLVRLAETVDLLEEIADKNAQLQSSLERSRRSEPPFSRDTTAPGTPESAESWDFLESSLAHLGDRKRLLDEFRRAGRYILKSGKVMFFFRKDAAFVSDDETQRCDGSHPLPLWLEEHPAILDFNQWDGTNNPAFDAPIHQQLQGWGARLLVPLHVTGQLVGWMALGPRADGAPYRDSDKFRSVLLGRLLERCLERSAQLEELQRTESLDALRAKYLPGVRLLTREALGNSDLPVEVRAVAGEVMHTGLPVVQPAQPPHRFRVSAGPVPEIDGVWVQWEEAAPEIERIRAQTEVHRRALLQNLGLTLSHELSNPLVSLVTFVQMLTRNSSPPYANAPASSAPSLAHEVAIATEVQKLQQLAEHAAVLGEISQPTAHATDVNALFAELATARGITTRFSEEQIIFNLDSALLRFAFSAILDAIAANRPDDGAKGLILTLRTVGADTRRTAVVTIEGKRLELDGTLPLPTANSVPNQGRLSVFLAREILRLHGGTLSAGPGIKGTDVQISFGPLT
jgi:signal transduction histidine kinase